VSSAVGAFIRRGPGTDYDIVGELLYDTTFSVLAYSQAGADIWYLIRLPDGEQAWISGTVSELTGGATHKQITLALTQPPTPSDTPTITPTFTATLPQGSNALVSGQLGVNLRTGAGYHYEILQVISTAAPLVLIGRDEENTWYQAVTFTDPPLTGWVNADYIEPLFDTRLLAITWDLPTAGIAGIDCGINIHPSGGFGYPIPPDLGQAKWVRFPFTSSKRYFPNLEAAFRYYDPVINAYNRLGVNIVLVLNHETYGETEGWRWLSMNSAQWSAFTDQFTPIIERVAAHYGERIAAYEIWNESDAEKGDPAAVAIPPRDYAHLLEGSAQAIRRVAPAVRVLMGGLLDPNGVYLRRVLLALGGYLPVDGIAIHPYGRGAPLDDSIFAQFGDISEVIEAYNRVAPGVPLWITEIGALGDNDPSRWGEAASYMNRLYGYLREVHAEQVDVIIWYAWSDEMHGSQRTNGLIDKNGQPKSPLYETFFRLCAG
jgi:hypothetical protein